VSTTRYPLEATEGSKDGKKELVGDTMHLQILHSENIPAELEAKGVAYGAVVRMGVVEGHGGFEAGKVMAALEFEVTPRLEDKILLTIKEFTPKEEVSMSQSDLREQAKPGEKSTGEEHLSPSMLNNVEKIMSLITCYSNPTVTIPVFEDLFRLNGIMQNKKHQST
jgi:hypothetical protein